MYDYLLIYQRYLLINSMKQQSAIILFAFSYTFAINLVKTLLVAVYSGDTFSPGLALNIINDFTVGILIAAVGRVFSHKMASGICVWTICLVAILIDFLAFHYFLVFGRLPGAGILFYITELDQLRSSFNTNVPVLLLFIEVLATVCVTGFFYQFFTRAFNRLFQGPIPILVSLVIVIASVFLQLFPTLLSDAFKWYARHEVVWLLQSALVREKYNLEDIKLTDRNFDRYLKALGNNEVKPLVDSEFPLCRYQQQVAAINKRSVILLILEGVSRNEMLADVDGLPLMPNLREIEADNLSLQNIYASGSKSAQALTAIFSGLPPHTNYHYLWTKPLINMTGFPKQLREYGYNTAYFHGSDLSFEQQRLYLKRIGFDYLYEYSPDHEHEIYGWGYADENMFSELQDWIKATDDNYPYLASLFTISTHDPYLLPETWSPRFSSVNSNSRSSINWTLLHDIDAIRLAARESYHYLDHQLGRFYQWYQQNEQAKGTLLVITGDHGSYLFTQEDHHSQLDQFRVPLIIAGKHDSLDNITWSVTSGLTGGLHDLPATIMGLLEGRPPECGVGIDLLADSSKYNDSRLVYSVSGDELEDIYIWLQDGAIVLDRSQEQLYQFKEGNKTDLSETDASSDVITMLDELREVLKVNYYLLKTDSYYPQRKANEVSIVATNNKDTIFVSHRGNIAGPGDASYENSRRALDNALAAGVDWVEVDVQLTADGIPVLLHDPYITLPGGTRVDVISKRYSELTTVAGYQDILTLEQMLQLYKDKINILVEVKAPEHISNILHMGREVARLVRLYSGSNKIIVDSFHDELITSIKQQCDCETGLDAPFKVPLNKEALDYIKSKNMDWVYLHYSVATPETISLAHTVGLKVMVYTVNTSEILSQWRHTTMPDGIITDDMSIVAMTNQADAGK